MSRRISISLIPILDRMLSSPTMPLKVPRRLVMLARRRRPWVVARDKSAAHLLVLPRSLALHPSHRSARSLQLPRLPTQFQPSHQLQSSPVALSLLPVHPLRLPLSLPLSLLLLLPSPLPQLLSQFLQLNPNLPRTHPTTLLPSAEAGTAHRAPTTALLFALAPSNLVSAIVAALLLKILPLAWLAQMVSSLLPPSATFSHVPISTVVLVLHASSERMDTYK